MRQEFSLKQPLTWLSCHGVGFLSATKGGVLLLRDSCGTQKLSWRDADDPLKLKAKMALIREAGAERDLGQAEPAVCPQEVILFRRPDRQDKSIQRRRGRTMFSAVGQVMVTNRL